MNLNEYIRDIPDFPKKGIIFKDITPLLRDKNAFTAAIKALAEPYRKSDLHAVAAIESRGFILGAALALELGIGFIPIRKPGKLPYKSRRRQYALEYGTDAIEIHEDAVTKGQRILLVDDVIATGGTARAAADLLKELGADLVGIAFLVELGFLGGVEKLQGEKIFSVLKY